MEQLFNIQEELNKLPKKPGVYIMKDCHDTILYVGKAINLHSRVRSYFRENIGRSVTGAVSFSAINSRKRFSTGVL